MRRIALAILAVLLAIALSTAAYSHIGKIDNILVMVADMAAPPDMGSVTAMSAGAINYVLMNDDQVQAAATIDDTRMFSSELGQTGIYIRMDMTGYGDLGTALLTDEDGLENTTYSDGGSRIPERMARDWVYSSSRLLLRT